MTQHDREISKDETLNVNKGVRDFNILFDSATETTQWCQR